MLPKLVGANAAADMMYSGRRVEAEEAARLGLVSGQIADDDALLDVVRAYAQEMASSASPRSLKIIKQQLQAAGSQTLGEASAYAYDALMDALGSEDFAEATASYRERRPPRFEGR